jgi:ferric-dicitrate binding protein FerR (iron transport regulator)
MDSIDYISLLNKVLLQQATAEEAARLETWANEKEEHQQLLNAYRTTWNLTQNYGDNIPVNRVKAWEELAQKIQVKDLSVVSTTKHFWLIKLMAAASVLLIITFSLLWSSASKTPKWLEIKANKELVRTVHLPDQSIATLEKGAFLKYAEIQGKRVVHVEGTVFFDVQKIQHQPFEVHANNTLIKVLGTSFAVVNEINTAEVQVHLTEGLLAFRHQGSDASIQLKGGESASFNHQKQRFQKQVLVKNRLAWKTKTLVFDNSRLDAVADELEHYFGIQINFDNPAIQNCHFTGVFAAANLEDILKILCFSSSLKIEKIHKKYSLSGQGCTLSK